MVVVFLVAVFAGLTLLVVGFRLPTPVVFFLLPVVFLIIFFLTVTFLDVVLPVVVVLLIVFLLVFVLFDVALLIFGLFDVALLVTGLRAVVALFIFVLRGIALLDETPWLDDLLLRSFLPASLMTSAWLVAFLPDIQDEAVLPEHMPASALRVKNTKKNKKLLKSRGAMITALRIAANCKRNIAAFPFKTGILIPECKISLAD